MLEDYMISIGFSTDDIAFIRSTYFQPVYSENSILYNFKNIVNYFHRNQLSNDDIIFIVRSKPEIINTSIENIKLKIDELSSMGFNKTQIFRMIKTYPYIFLLDYK